VEKKRPTKKEDESNKINYDFGGRSSEREKRNREDSS